MSRKSIAEKYADLSNEELEKIVDVDDHRFASYEEEEDSGPFHVYWDCPTCDAESVLETRRRQAESLLPGWLPEMKTAVLHNIKVSALKVGTFARYSGLPGATNRSHYVECLSIEPADDGGVKASWRKTNSDEEPFFVTYPADFSVDVVEPGVGRNG